MSDGGLGIAHLADIEEIGSGGSGVLYVATDLKLDRRVAVRVMNPPADAADRDRFIRESQLLGSLSSHPNVVTIYDAGFTDSDEPYLIMELVEGDNLAAILSKQGTLAWNEAADLTLQICAGLEQAHRSGVLHRDLRPQNVLMVGTAPKLTDFGISGEATFSPSAMLAGDTSTMEHRAPESFDDVWDERSDLYSLASMLYQMVDGRAPFHRPSDNSPDALRLRLIHEQSPGLNPDLAPAAMSVFLSAALSKDAFDRPQTANEFAHELRLIKEGRTTGSTPSVLHGTGPIPLAADPTTMGPPPDRPEPAPVSFSNEAASPAPVAAAAVGMAAAASVTQSVNAPATVGSQIVSAGMVGTQSAAPSVFDVAAPGPQTINTTPVGEYDGGPAPLSFQPADQNEWAPPPSGDGHTAVYSNFASSPEAGYSPSQRAENAPLWSSDHAAYEPQAEHPLVEQAQFSERPTIDRRSPAFLAAVGMIALGVLGLATVLAFSAFGSDDETPAAPLLPDPTQPVVAGTEAGPESSVGGTTSTTLETEAVEDTPTSVETMEETTTTTVQRYTVPRVIGQNVIQATQRLTEDGFQVLVVERASIANPGIVTQQKPDPGDLVTLPLTVTLYVPEVSNLPDMIGRPADEVCLELQALKLTCTRVIRNDPNLPAGTVIATNPAAGAPINEGTAVQVTVSLGPVLAVAVPSLAGQTATEAEATLSAEGFSMFSFVVEPSETVPVDRVIGSSPGAGETLATDQVVTVRVSSGPAAKVTIPELVGMNTADAEAAVRNLGLTVNVATQDLQAGDPNIGKVLTTDPGQGTEVAVGSAVTITVGQQAPESNNGGG